MEKMQLTRFGSHHKSKLGFIREHGDILLSTEVK